MGKPQDREPQLKVEQILAPCPNNKHFADNINNSLSLDSDSWKP